MGSSATSVRERPILFSGAMVRALLDARKTVTRRVVKITHRTPGLAAALLPPAGIAPRPHVAAELCPYGQPGDRLWVREGWGYEPWTEESERRVLYRASTVDGDRTMRWRPSIHMPRWASRITLEITEVRVERVQDISEEDAVAEGIEEFGTVQRSWISGSTALGALAGIMGANPALSRRGFLASLVASGAIALGADGKAERATPRAAFGHLWESIHGAGAWERNDWVWVVRFRRVGAA